MDVKRAQVINLEKICRLCLHENQSLTEIFETPGDHNYLTIDQKITSCASIDLSKDDGLPRKICSKCLSSVNAAFDFKIQCRNSDKLLREINDVLTANKTTEEKVEVNSGGTDSRERNSANKQVAGNFSHVIFIKEDEMETCPREMRDESFRVIDDGRAEEKVGSRQKEGSVVCEECFFSGEPSDSGRSERGKVGKSDFEKCNQVSFVVSAESEESERRIVVDDLERGAEMVAKDESGSEEEGKCAAVGNSGKLPCPFCKKMISRIDEHIRLLHRNRVYKCTKIGCGAEFSTLKNLQSHQLICYDVKKAYKCLRCSKEFHRKSNFKAHVKRHGNRKDFECQLCDRAFVDSTGLRRHFLKHHEPEQEIFVSGCCGKRFKSKEGLKKHVRKRICGIRVFHLIK